MAQLRLHHPGRSRAATEAQARSSVVPNDYYEDFHDSYFLEFIRQELVNRYGEGVLAAGDLKVYTTIDPHLSDLATTGDHRRPRRAGRPLRGARLREPQQRLRRHDGAVGELQRSRSTTSPTDAQRQPGSTFKAIVLADALAHGIDPFTTDYLSHTLEPGWLASVPTYTVSIDGGGNLDAPLNLDEALVASDNTVFAQLAADLGEPSVTQMAYAMGVLPGTLHSYPAEALGGLTVGVTPLEMANVYATIADGGWRNKQITITKVVFPDGRVDRSWGVPHRVKVLSTAGTPTSRPRSSSTTSSTAPRRSRRSAARPPPRPARPAASSTPGSTASRPTARRSSGWATRPRTSRWTTCTAQAQYGGDLPAQIWHNFMNQVVTPPCTPLPNPADDPMTYVPFSGHYQQLGLESYVPPKRHRRLRCDRQASTARAGRARRRPARRAARHADQARRRDDEHARDARPRRAAPRRPDRRRRPGPGAPTG